jgi:hypothetical protein
MSLKQYHSSPWIWLLPLTIIVISIVLIVLSVTNQIIIDSHRIEYDYYLASHGTYQYTCTILDIREPFVSFALVESFYVYAWNQTVPSDHNNGLQLGPSACWTYEEYLCAPNSMSIIANLEDKSNYLRAYHVNAFIYDMGCIGLVFSWFLTGSIVWRVSSSYYERV